MSHKAETTPSDAAQQVAELEADLRRTRADLAQAVDQLAAKLDVKTRVRNRVADARAEASYELRRLRQRATGADGRPTTTAVMVTGGAVVAVAAVVGLNLWRRRR
jgi:hypothetical protein